MKNKFKFFVVLLTMAALVITITGCEDTAQATTAAPETTTAAPETTTAAVVAASPKKETTTTAAPETTTAAPETTTAPAETKEQEVVETEPVAEAPQWQEPVYEEPVAEAPQEPETEAPTEPEPEPDPVNLYELALSLIPGYSYVGTDSFGADVYKSGNNAVYLTAGSDGSVLIEISINGAVAEYTICYSSAEVINFMQSYPL